MKHAYRYQEIILAFLRNGFGYLVKDIGILEALSLSSKKITKRTDISQKTLGERLRILLEELGTTFIKLGQIASTRRDLLPEKVIAELEKLQDHVSAFSFTEVNEIVKNELGQEINEVFEEFQETPIASASMGQVHFASLSSGEKVAVKVQRPNIDSIVETDLEILEDLARLMESQMDWAKEYNILDIIQEFSKALREELDFGLEGRNGEKIAKQFKNNPSIFIPKIHWEYSTKRVLTMDYIEGIKINDLEKMEEKGYDRKNIAEKFAGCMIQQIFIAGYFHGDPHPGNVIILPGEVICLIDFGMVGRLSPETKYQFVSLILSLKNGDTDEILKTLLQMGLFPENVNHNLLRFDIEMIRDKYYDLPLSQLSIGDAVSDMFKITNKYHIRIPAELTVLGKSLMTLEGIVSYLNPDCNIMGVAEPFATQLMKDRYNPKKVLKTTWSQVKEITEVLASLPKDIKQLSSTINKGKLHFEISIPELHIILKKLDTVSNRLSFSIVLLAFSIVMVGLVIGSSIGRQSTILWELPIIEIGGVVASLMFLWLLFSIFRSGRF